MMFSFALLCTFGVDFTNGFLTKQQFEDLSLTVENLPNRGDDGYPIEQILGFPMSHEQLGNVTLTGEQLSRFTFTWSDLKNASISNAQYAQLSLTVMQVLQLIRNSDQRDDKLDLTTSQKRALRMADDPENAPDVTGAELKQYLLDRQSNHDIGIIPTYHSSLDLSVPQLEKLNLVVHGEMLIPLSADQKRQLVLREDQNRLVVRGHSNLRSVFLNLAQITHLQGIPGSELNSTQLSVLSLTLGQKKSLKLTRNQLQQLTHNEFNALMLTEHESALLHEPTDTSSSLGLLLPFIFAFSRLSF